MKVPKRVQYGITIMATIGAYATDSHYVSVIEIANMYNFPSKVLENVVANLRFNNLVVSHRGCKNGGYRLTKDPKNITLAEIIQALDNNILGGSCRKYHPRFYNRKH